MADFRDPRTDPHVGDVLDWPAGDDVHRLTVTERLPRHVHADRRWPDGTTTRARFWIRQWRACMGEAAAVVLDGAPVEPA